MKFLRWLSLCFFVLVVATTANASPLPLGFMWGMGQDECADRLKALGYARLNETSEGSEPSSHDIILKRHALANGLQTLCFEKGASSAANAAEKVTVYLHNSRLYRMTVKFEDFGKDFHERKLSQLTSELSAPPRHLRGRGSKMDMYIWQIEGTGIRFAYKEVPSIPFYFAEIEYAQLVVVEELKRQGLR